MLKKSEEIFLKKPKNPPPQGNLRFYVLETLHSQTEPITITCLYQLLIDQDLFLTRRSVRNVIAEILNLPHYGLETSIVDAGRSRATAYFIPTKTNNGTT